MKKLLLLSIAILPLLCTAQDDLYFVSKKAKKETVVRPDLRARTEKVAPADVVDYHSSRRDDDEYNRRYSINESEAAPVDTVEAATDDCIDDPEYDFRYSRRLVRFHSPRFYAAASPYYWDLYYGWGAWDYLYVTYDPWYWDYGWGCGLTWGPWNCWYGGIWGYRPLHAWAYWGWGPGWYGPSVGRPIYRNSVPRELNSSRGHMAAADRLRTSAMRGGLVSASRTSALGTRSTATGVRTSAGTSVRGTATRNTSSYAPANGRYDARRSNAATRADERRGNYSVPSRSQSNVNSSTRTATRTQGNVNSNTRTRTDNSSNTRMRTDNSSNTRTSTRSDYNYSAPTRSSSSGSFSSGSSMGGGTRSSGGGFGGGGSRGGGGGGGRR